MIGGGKSNRSPFGGGLMARAGGGLNKAAPQMPNVPKAPGLAQASGVIEGDYTIQDPRINKGAPTNVPTVWQRQAAPFPRNDPRFREWVVSRARKARQRFRSFQTLEEALAAAKAYGQAR